MVVRSIDSIVTSVRFIKLYSAGLIATVRRKSCVEMSKRLSVSHDKLNRALNKETTIDTIGSILSSIVSKWCTPGWLIIDDTLVAKVFARLIPGLDIHKDSSSGNFTKGLCIVVIAWTNGIITIPLGFKCWFSKNI